MNDSSSSTDGDLPSRPARGGRPVGDHRRSAQGPPARGGNRSRRRQPKRFKSRDSADRESPTSIVGNIELEFGVPFAGTILPAEQWAKTALKRLQDGGTIDFVQLFGRDAPRMLDIGCGNGRFLLSSAVRRPDMDHIGIDALPMVIRYATRRANVRGLSNCRLAVCDGARFLRQYCAPSSLHEIHVYHPQPFPDATEAHLRLFQHEFLWLIHQALVPGGKLFVQTDNGAYWNYLQAVLPTIMDWHLQTEPWPEDPQGRSRREIVALNKGLTIYRGWGSRRDELTRAEFDDRCQSLPVPNFNAQHNRNPNQWRR